MLYLNYLLASFFLKHIIRPGSELFSTNQKNNEVIIKSSTWRLFNVEVPHDLDPGKNDVLPHSSLISAVIDALPLKRIPFNITNEDVTVVKKAFDGRWKKSGQPKWVYTIDLAIPKTLKQKFSIKEVKGRIEKVLSPRSTDSTDINKDTSPLIITGLTSSSKPSDTKIVVVGAGPSGLFAATRLVEAGYKPIIIERGEPVEVRGRDIGALFNRKILNGESNLCYGEGGAGTWSDGKLTTRIGKNSDVVRDILRTLVKHGAPDRILVDNKPHLGTDRLVRILKDMRQWLMEHGAEFRFGTKVENICIGSQVDNGKRFVNGVLLSTGEKIDADFVVLAVGHSARQLYRRLQESEVALVAKPIAVGFRIEHPQELINKIQYGDVFSQQCLRGKGPVPVADYRLATQVKDALKLANKMSRSSKDTIVSEYDDGYTKNDCERACYSFCMCPGGQIVPTSVDPNELCVNGMSFSQRQSPFANAALVVSVEPEDLGIFSSHDDPLLGVAWQQEMERKAAIMGGGNLVSPVQRVTDFLAEHATPADGGSNAGSDYYAGMSFKIPSSYRMGVTGAACHTLYPDYVTKALQKALLNFDRQLPGFITPDAILHGVETRTSSPIQISRDADSFECVNVARLYPTGEGAGYAGGIVSAAVDGVHVAHKITALIEGRSVTVTKRVDASVSDKKVAMPNKKRE